MNNINSIKTYGDLRSFVLDLNIPDNSQFLFNNDISIAFTDQDHFKIKFDHDTISEFRNIHCIDIFNVSKYAVSCIHSMYYIEDGEYIGIGGIDAMQSESLYRFKESNHLLEELVSCMKNI